MQRTRRLTSCRRQRKRQQRLQQPPQHHRNLAMACTKRQLPISSAVNSHTSPKTRTDDECEVANSALCSRVMVSTPMMMQHGISMLRQLQPLARAGEMQPVK